VPNRDDVARTYRILHNEEIHNVYALQNVIRIIKLKMRWHGRVGRMGMLKNACNILVGTPRHGWEYNTRMDLS